MYTADYKRDFHSVLSRGETKAIAWSGVIKNKYDSIMKQVKKSDIVTTTLYDLLYGRSNSDNQFAFTIKSNFDIKDNVNVQVLKSKDRVIRAWIIDKYVYIGSGSKVTRFKYEAKTD